MSHALDLPTLSPDEARRVDQTCDRFEAAWKAGGRPSPEEYLGMTGEPERSALVRQLLLLDWDYRRRAEDNPCADDYHSRFPGDGALIEEVIREMTASPGSTHTGSDGPGAPHANWTLGKSPVSATEVAAGLEADPDRYELVQEVGQGGIGMVFRGRDRRLGRELAIKVLREQYQDKPEARRRFLAEAQVGSQLQHPAIVPVYELGSFGDGRPFFTMRLVEGRTLAALLQDRHGLAGDVPRWLGILEQVCQAIAYAHSRGVIHRDLKPANVMVGAFGEVQVMDWGFAKKLSAGDGQPTTDDIENEPWATAERRFELADAAGITHSGTLMGTPAYMPPEQARGQTALVDRRSDVFSLGAILCEVLTGHPPYEGSNSDELCRKAAAGDLADAHARLDGAAVDVKLRELAKRCLSAARSDRPPDAGVVAGELKAYLTSAQEQLRQAQLERAAAEARAQEAGAKAQAERRTRRLTLALAAAVVLLALGAVAVPTISLVALRAEQQRTRDALGEEAERRRTARQALDLLTGPLVEDWLARQATLSPEHRRFLENALRYYEEFAADTGQQEEARAGVAQAYVRVGEIRHLLGQRKEAEAAWQRSRELYAGLATDFAGVPTYREALARGHWTLARFYRNTGRALEAESALTQSLVLRRSLVAEYPDLPGYQQGLAGDLHILGLLLKDLARFQEAEVAYGQAETILTQLAARFPDEPIHLNELAQVYLDLGELLHGISGRSREAVLRNPGRSAEAAKAIARAVTIHEQLVAKFPETTRYREMLAGSHNTLGNFLRDAGQYPEAERSFGSAVTARKQLVEEFPGVPHYRRGLAITLNNLGILLKNTDRAEKAEEMYREALEIHKKLAADSPDVPDRQNEVAGGMVNLARMLLMRKELDGARRLLEEALPYHRAALTARPQDLAYRNFYRLNRWRMTETLLELKDHAAAATAAGQFLEQRVEMPRDAYTAAGLLAGCVRLAARDDRLPESKRLELATVYGDRAVAALHHAVDTGFKDVARMKMDSNLEPLRASADFQKLVAGLEQSRKAP